MYLKYRKACNSAVVSAKMFNDILIETSNLEPKLVHAYSVPEITVDNG